MTNLAAGAADGGATGQAKLSLDLQAGEGQNSLFVETINGDHVSADASDATIWPAKRNCTKAPGLQ